MLRNQVIMGRENHHQIAEGKAGKIGEVYINGEKIYLFPAIDLLPGDIVELHIAGGGGFGPVEKRAEQRILYDLAFGYITPRSVEQD